jgi:glycosyltransferase involved in cell wall biosynthesis
VPNGVDIDFFRPAAIDSSPGTLLFNGVLDYHPNRDAVEYLLTQVLPRIRERRPDVRLKVVGRGAPAELERLRRAGLEVTGEVPDLRPHLQEAAVVLVPIRMGGGTRLKVLEGLAMARPMVSTSIGCEGIDVRDGEHLLIADTADAFADQVDRILGDPALAARLGHAGRTLVEDRYSWDRAGDRLEDLYRSVVPAAAAAAAF